jgi:hypothetical protein
VLAALVPGARADDARAADGAGGAYEDAILGAGYHLQVMVSGAFANPSAYGADFAAAALLRPLAGRGWFIGPRLGGLVATGSTTTRADLNSGIETALWFANAIAPGLAAEVAIPSYDSSGGGSSPHFRFESLISARIQHYHHVGAWALRLGLNYDTFYRWGGTAGISLQFSGVPQIGVEEAPGS